MATPTWVGFDVAPRPRAAILGDAAGLLRARGFRLERLTDLVAGGDGVEVGENEAPCGSLEEALEEGRDWAGLVLSFAAAPLGGHVHVYAWRDVEGEVFGMEVPQAAPYYGDPEGFWLQEFLCDAADALEANLVIYSADQPVLERARLDGVASRLRLGNIFRFLLVKQTELAYAQFEEIQELAGRSGMTYFPMGEAYYVWSRLVRVTGA